jgi:cell division septal protein FtsQ
VSRYAARRDQGQIVPRTTASPPSQRGHRGFARLVGALGMVTLTGLLFWLLTDDGFRVTEADVTFTGLRHADEAEVRALLSDLDRAPNVFRVRAGDIVSELSQLTEVDAAAASVTLPANVRVELDERDPLFIWSDGQESWLVDDAGMLFGPAKTEEYAADAATDPGAADADADDAATDPDAATATNPAAATATNAATNPDATPNADATARAALPIVRDSRLTVDPPVEGSFLSAIDMEVMRHLLALTPELLGSRSQDLQLTVDDVNGYVLESRDRGWDALFGYYTPSLQPPDRIPRQVQCLRWVLASEENGLERVWLALGEESCGTLKKVEPSRRKPG